MNAALDATTETPGVPALLETRALVPADVFKPGGVMALLARLEADVRAVKTDISTAIGREQVRSLAYKVARSKTALDAMGKALTDDARAQIDAVNAERRAIRERLDALAEPVRAAADPAGRGRQYLAAKVRALDGTRAASFVLTRSPSGGRWGPDRYALRLAPAEARAEPQLPPMPPMTPMRSGVRGDAPATGPGVWSDDL